MTPSFVCLGLAVVSFALAAFRGPLRLTTTVSLTDLGYALVVLALVVR